MGGYGSGRWGGVQTIERTGALILDVSRLLTPTMQACRKVGLSGIPEDRTITLPPLVWRWTRDGDAEPLAEVNITVTLGADWGEAGLAYDIVHLSRATGAQRQQIRLIASPCRFGGVRWWWICPATGRRCAKLYLPNGGRLFLSRGPGAYRLGYGTALDRAHWRARRLYRKLGSDYHGTSLTWPPKPKRMRWRTYERIIAELEDCEERLDTAWLATAARWLART